MSQEAHSGDVAERLSYVAVWPLYINMFSAFLCMGFSAFYHLFYVRSKTLFDVL